VIAPRAVTVATPIFVLAHVPPEGDADNDEVPAIHNVSGPVYATVGFAITVADTGSDGQLEPVAV
jgi:hypothetical protein